MLKFLFTFILIYISWLFLTFSASASELFAGFIVSIIVASISRGLLFRSRGLWILNPVRWLRFLVYILVFIAAEIRAHLDLGYRVVTGRVNPAIVQVKSANKTDAGKTLLGNSITLTPGTLTVEVGDDLYIHCISFTGKKPGKLFQRFGRMI
jgi:multicomponent Na+:H+ antiporter subunit E